VSESRARLAALVRAFVQAGVLVAIALVESAGRRWPTP
jgi:hypothetical protein